MLAALLLGGGGGGAPLHNMIIALVAIVVLVLVFWHPPVYAPGRAERVATLMLILIVITPIAQLVPLPHAFWSTLPGRDFVVGVDELIGNSNAWRPLSLDPESTWLSATALLPGAAMFLVTLRLGEHERQKLLGLVVATAMLSLLLGAFQLAAGGGAFQIYNTAHREFATGLFANRNHQADLLLIAMLLGSSMIWRHSRMRQSARWLLWLTTILAMSAGVIATSSRMGFLLLPLAIAGSITFIPRIELQRHKFATLAGALAVLIAISLVAMSAGAQRVITRFDTLSDLRYDFWAEAMIAGREYFPWGSGLGTFSIVYQAVEDLNKVGPAYVNHAHNEYVQVFVEAGAWGLLLIIMFGFLFAWLAGRKAGKTQYRRAVSFSILIILLHSVVDYPLRMAALITLFGFVCALLLPAPPIERERSAKVQRGWKDRKNSI